MRDGTVLKADVYRPLTRRKVPVILQRLPYDKAVAEYSPVQYERPEYFAAHCYLVVNQDVRGEYQSRGSWYPFAHEMQDGYDSVEWAARLPGSNGRVGMYGISYVGATQWLAATQAPPHLKTIVPGNTGSDYYDGWTYQGGALALAFAESWPLTTIARSAADHRGDWDLVDQMERNTSALPSTWYRFLLLDRFPPLDPGNPNVAPYFFDWLAHPTNDAYWQPVEHPAPLRPDQSPGAVVRGLVRLVSHRQSRELHRHATLGRLGDRPALPADPDRPVGAPQLEPLPTLSRSAGDGLWAEREQPDQRAPAALVRRWLKRIDNGVTRRPAVRLFVMGANRWLNATDWPVPGTRTRRFWLSSGGHANTATGDGRLASRRPAASPTDTGQVYRYRIDVWPTANLFAPGHRMLLEISSSNFPAYDRNLNTGAFATSDLMRAADQTIYHDAAHPSELAVRILPTVR